VSVDAEPFADRFPSYLTRFVGREQEIAELEAILEPHGLITVCGVGGLGKSGSQSRWRGGSRRPRTLRRTSLLGSVDGDRAD
jgi:hypothetical protein